MRRTIPCRSVPFQSKNRLPLRPAGDAQCYGLFHRFAAFLRYRCSRQSRALLECTGSVHGLVLNGMARFLPDRKPSAHVHRVPVPQVVHRFGRQRRPFVEHSVHHHFGRLVRDQLVDVEVEEPRDMLTAPGICSCWYSSLVPDVENDRLLLSVDHPLHIVDRDLVNDRLRLADELVRRFDGRLSSPVSLTEHPENNKNERTNSNHLPLFIIPASFPWISPDVKIFASIIYAKIIIFLCRCQPPFYAKRQTNVIKNCRCLYNS